MKKKKNPLCRLKPVNSEKPLANVFMGDYMLKHNCTCLLQGIAENENLKKIIIIAQR